MTSPIQFSAEASAELESAATWYDEQRAGLGAEFMDTIDEVIETLAEWPHSGAPVDGMPPELEVRRAPIARFPYHVGYVVLDERVRILAVAHDRRRPTYWAPRAGR